jgi:hypothetical protein
MPAEDNDDYHEDDDLSGPLRPGERIISCNLAREQRPVASLVSCDRGCLPVLTVLSRPDPGPVFAGHDRSHGLRSIRSDERQALAKVSVSRRVVATCGQNGRSPASPAGGRSSLTSNYGPNSPPKPPTPGPASPRRNGHWRCRFYC